MHHFNNYTIIKQIGEGGMASVFLATHNSLNHPVAIKILNKEFVFNSNIRSRFIDEARKMVRMNHPNVVKVSDLINQEDSVAIVMEFVDGQTLKDILEQKKLTDFEIKHFLKQMLSALVYIHSQGLIHRDIKPSNFILGNDGNLKLTDFGISKTTDFQNIELTQTSTAMSLGSPMYMSPEQVRSTKDVTYLTDIYSLGVILWEMVTYKKPYSTNTISVFDLQLKIVQEKLPFTNTKWDSIIQKATQKDEFKRIKSAEDFLLILDKDDFSEVHFDNTILSNDLKYSINNNKSKSIFLKKKWYKSTLFYSIAFLVTIFCIYVFIFNKSQNNNFSSKVILETEIIHDSLNHIEEITHAKQFQENDFKNKLGRPWKVEKIKPCLFKNNQFYIVMYLKKSINLEFDFKMVIFKKIQKSKIKIIWESETKSGEKIEFINVLKSKNNALISGVFNIGGAHQQKNYYVIKLTDSGIIYPINMLEQYGEVYCNNNSISFIESNQKITFKVNNNDILQSIETKENMIPENSVKAYFKLKNNIIEPINKTLNISLGNTISFIPTDQITSQSFNKGKIEIYTDQGYSDFVVCEANRIKSGNSYKFDEPGIYRFYFCIDCYENQLSPTFNVIVD